MATPVIAEAALAPAVEEAVQRSAAVEGAVQRSALAASAVE
jgi:hypothetical protein